MSTQQLLRLLGKLGTRRDFVQSTLDLPFSDPPTLHHDAKRCRKVIEILQRIAIE